MNSPKYLIAADQANDRMGLPYKPNDFAVFDNPNVGKKFVDSDGVMYRRDAFSIDYASNDYLDQYRALKIFW